LGAVNLPSLAQTCRNAPRLFGRGLIAIYCYTLASLLRCQPWGTSGLDFVPQALPEKSRWYMPWRYGRWRGTNSSPSSPHLAGPDAAGR
jgi:hypothetical protein